MRVKRNPQTGSLLELKLNRTKHNKLNGGTMELSFLKDLCIGALVVAFMLWGWAQRERKEWKSPWVAIAILLTTISAISFVESQPLANFDQFVSSGALFPMGALLVFLIASIVFDVN
jgi:hypothetical protein